MEDGVGKFDKTGLFVKLIANNQFFSFAVNKQWPDGHSGFELQCFPILTKDGKCDGVILDTGLCLCTKSSTLFYQIHQLSCHGNLGLRLLGKGDADGVADTLGEQCADAQCTLDAPVLTLASLGDT